MNKEEFQSQREERFVSKYSIIINTAIFNTSSLILTPVEKVLLGLGTKYIPYPKNKNNSINNIIKLTTHTIYQKERNIYQYIPMMSEHSPYIFQNFIIQELKRYRLACTSDTDYNKICTLFSQRLTARGYPPDIFSNALQKAPSRIILMTLFIFIIFTHIKFYTQINHCSTEKNFYFSLLH